jgi:periplasmic divalent cation tolerance protein
MHIVIFITSANKNEARRIAAELLEQKLVACVNIIDKVLSFFRWKKKINKASEVLMVAKSTSRKLARIIDVVRSLHSYEVPEIIALPIAGGNKDYLDWIDESIR